MYLTAQQTLKEILVGKVTCIGAYNVTWHLQVDIPPYFSKSNICLQPNSR